MTDNSHPITPPPELAEQWTQMKAAEPEVTRHWVHIATQAARWGADQELDACCEWLDEHLAYENNVTDNLRLARRPKPPSLKELNLKHLEVMERDGHYLPEIIADLRRVLESLPN